MIKFSIEYNQDVPNLQWWSLADSFFEDLNF
jgi:hypothetical protein